MPNEDIITSLRNAIEHGETLESAKQVMINSGYNPWEVEQATQFVSGGVIPNYQPTPEEQFTMPNQKKSFFSRFKPKQKNVSGSPALPNMPPKKLMAQTSPQQPFHAQQPPAYPQPAYAQQIKQEISSQTQFPQQTSQMPGTIQHLNQQPARSQIIQARTLGNFATPTQKELKKIKPTKPGHAKEIILLVILLALIGTLILTIVMKDTILGWFS